MPELIAKSPLEGQAPRDRGGLRIEALAEGPIWSVALFPGGAKAAARALKGLGFPGPGEWVEKSGLRLVWTGRDQAFLFGELSETAAAGLAGHAAVTDQSGGWAGFSVSGPGAEAALARLVAVDLRPAAFAVGRVVRTGLNHLPAILLRTGADAFEIRVFRSMARTAWHELTEVQDRLEARGG